VFASGVAFGEVGGFGGFGGFGEGGSVVFVDDSAIGSTGPLFNSITSRRKMLKVV
jgi:hypothetical protein